MAYTHDQPDAKVVICDDSRTNIAVMKKVLQEMGIAEPASFSDPRKALEHLLANKEAVDLLILDLDMPHLDGFAVMSALFTDGGQARQAQDGACPVLVITGNSNAETRHRALDAGASDFVNKSTDKREMALRARNLLRIRRAWKRQADESKRLEVEVRRRTRELEDSVDALANRLGRAGELRDSETGRHVERVGRFSLLLAQAAQLPADLCRMIEKAAPLHDVGKIGIPDAILHKKGKLTAEEMKVMEGHTTYGGHLLSGHDSDLIQLAASIAEGHHEKWDGSGYPRGLSGEAIPIAARVVALADVFDALTTKRPYKDPWPPEKALAIIKEGRGKHFDPNLVDCVERIYEDFVETMERMRDIDPSERGALEAALECVGGSLRGEFRRLDYAKGKASARTENAEAELRRDDSGDWIRAIRGMVFVDKARLAGGQEVRVGPGSVVGLGGTVWVYEGAPRAEDGARERRAGG